MTTKAEIRTWLEKGLEQGDNHVIIACDTFDHSDYPIYIPHGTNPRDQPTGPTHGTTLSVRCRRPWSATT